MATINSVIVEGNLVRAAELSRWGDGTPYCRFTVTRTRTGYGRTFRALLTAYAKALMRKAWQSIF